MFLDQNSFPETAPQKQYRQCYIPSEAKLNAGSENLCPNFLGVIVKNKLSFTGKNWQNDLFANCYTNSFSKRSLDWKNVENWLSYINSTETPI